MFHVRSFDTLLLVLLLCADLLLSEAFTTTSFRTRSTKSFNSDPRYSHNQQQRRSNCAPNSFSSTSIMSATESSSLVEISEVSDETWDAYSAAMMEMLKSKRVLKKDKLEDLEEAKTALLSRNLISINATSQLSGATTRDEWRKQGWKYMEHYNLSAKQFQFVMRCLVYLGDYCAKRRTSSPIQVGWEKLKEAGIVVAENAFSTYMYILGTHNNCRDTLIEVAKMHDVFYEPNEKTITLQIKALIAKSDIAEAEQILSSLEGGNDGNAQKLRTFLPILEHYCRNGDCKAILRIFRDMREAPAVYFDADTYTLILCALAEEGCFSTNAPPIKDADKIMFNASSGPMLFYQLATEMAEDLLELTEGACRKLSVSLSKTFSLVDVGDVDDIPLLPNSNSTQPVSSPLVMGRVQIDGKTALCPATGAKLRLIALDGEQRQHVHDTLIEMAGIQFIEFTKNRKRPINENHGLVELTKFSEYLSTREGEPFTVVVDGPNVGLYGCGKFRYSQVNEVVEELERMGERPLVIMPQKYIGPIFYLRKGPKQHLSKRDLEFVEKLKEDKKIYIVPHLCLDDYYWMLASVSNQTVSRQSKDLTVSSSEKGRFPGVRPILVTNDQMRDHKLGLLKSREFRRWSSCHIVNYQIEKTDGDEWEEKTTMLFPADFFSREIQCNPWGEGAARDAWHFPVTEWNENDRFLISIAR